MGGIKELGMMADEMSKWLAPLSPKLARIVARLEAAPRPDGPVGHLIRSLGLLAQLHDFIAIIDFPPGRSLARCTARCTLHGG